MRVIQQKVRGRMVGDGVFWLRTKADRVGGDVDVSESAGVSYLRYAFVTRGSELAVYPSSMLDDWGNEIRKLELYAWVEENGDAFPRGEIFGLDHGGKETQIFLRDLELAYRYLAVVAPSREAVIADCVPLHHILISNPAVSDPARCKVPSAVTTPLRRARIKWWDVPLDYSGDFEFLTISGQ